MLDAELPVDQELGVEAVEAVVLGREGLIVPGVHVLDHRPRGPARRETALGGAGADKLLAVLLDLLPGLRRLGRIEPGLGERVLVVVEDRRGRVERHRVEIAVLRVVAHHGRDELLPVDLEPLLREELIDGKDGARQHHGLGADLEDLHDVRWILLPIRGDGRGQRLRVRPLAQRLHLVFVLARVELLHQLVHGIAELSGHGMPEVDLRLGERGRGVCRAEGGEQDERPGRRGPELHCPWHGSASSLSR